MSLLAVHAIQRWFRELKEDCINDEQVKIGWSLANISRTLEMLEGDIQKQRSNEVDLQDFSEGVYIRMLKSISNLEAYDFEKTQLTKDLIEELEAGGWKNLGRMMFTKHPAYAVRAIDELHPEWVEDRNEGGQHGS